MVKLNNDLSQHSNGYDFNFGYIHVSLQIIVISEKVIQDENTENK